MQHGGSGFGAADKQVAKTGYPAIQGLQWHCTLLYSKVVAKSVQGPSRGKTLPDSFGCLWHIVRAKAWQLRLSCELRDQVGVGCDERRGTPGTLHGEKKTKECIEQW